MYYTLRVCSLRIFCCCFGIILSLSLPFSFSLSVFFFSFPCLFLLICALSLQVCAKERKKITSQVRRERDRENVRQECYFLCGKEKERLFRHTHSRKEGEGSLASHSTYIHTCTSIESAHSFSLTFFTRDNMYCSRSYYSRTVQSYRKNDIFRISQGSTGEEEIYFV